jgi:PilZ domain
MDHRHEYRYQVWEPVILSIGDGEVELHRSAHLVDISKSGLRVVTDLQIKSGTPIHVALGHLSLEATVTHCTRHGRDMWALGAEITSLELHGANRAEAQAHADQQEARDEESVTEDDAASVKSRRKPRPLATFLH